MAVLPKKVKSDKSRSNGTAYRLPKGFKGIQTAAASSIEQLKKDTESRPSKEVRLKDGEAITVRFLHEPIYPGKRSAEGWHRFDEHYVHEGKAGSYVPCIGDGCPLDNDPNARGSRKWLANVLDAGTGEVRLLKMTKAMVDSLIIKFERSAKGGKDPSIMRRNYTIIRIGDDQQTKYEIENEDPGPIEVNGRKIKLEKLKLIDIEEELNERVQRFYGGGTKNSAKSASLDEDDDEEEEDEDDEELVDEDEEEEEDDEEDEDSDEDEDEEDDEEDDEPVKKPSAIQKRKLPGKKKVRR